MPDITNLLIQKNTIIHFLFSCPPVSYQDIVVPLKNYAFFHLTSFKTLHPLISENIKKHRPKCCLKRNNFSVWHMTIIESQCNLIKGITKGENWLIFLHSVVTDVQWLWWQGLGSHKEWMVKAFACSFHQEQLGSVASNAIDYYWSFY